jgi:hypothetical protein
MYCYHIHYLPHLESHFYDHHSHHNDEKPLVLLLLLAIMDFWLTASKYYEDVVSHDSQHHGKW